MFIDNVYKYGGNLKTKKGLLNQKDFHINHHRNIRKVRRQFIFLQFSIAIYFACCFSVLCIVMNCYGLLLIILNYGRHIMFIVKFSSTNALSFMY